MVTKGDSRSLDYSSFWLTLRSYVLALDGDCDDKPHDVDAVLNGSPKG